MNRFERRLRARMRDEEFAAGYREMDRIIGLCAAYARRDYPRHSCREARPTSKLPQEDHDR